MTVTDAPAYDFDKPLSRRETGAIKWTMYDADVLPMWVADMDFESPRCIADAIARRAQDHSLFGYHFDHQPLRDLITARMAERYNWTIDPSHIVFLPSLVVGLNLVCQLYGGTRGHILTLAPIYPPFLSAPKNHRQRAVQVEALAVRDGADLRYEFDFAALEAAITPKTRVLMLCNPHNPVGRVFSRVELEQVAAMAERHNLTVISDEIHCDLILDPDQRHTPLASLSPEAAARTVTLMAPSKTFNVPGMGLGFAIVTDDALRKTMMTAMWSGTVAHSNVMGYVAAEAAYRGGQPWLDAALAYLRANRDAVTEYVRAELPGVAVTTPEATFLSWLDFRQTPLAADPYKLLLEKGRVALNNGKDFGKGGEGFARLNFATPRAALMDGLARIKRALTEG
ncbi:MAG: PatB family C-S lyase [Anaerolineae bacterium]|jgi:cystathionine beta-lyase|nr:PatB family C-S lyase [Anaerolineae bacterium]